MTDRAPADLILFNANVWTVDKENPVAQAVAVRGSHIARVGTDASVLELKGPGTRLVDLGGAMVVPGFIDAHTHFENAVKAFFTARVRDVLDQSLLDERLIAATERVPEGLWITGTDMSGAAAARAAKNGDGSFTPFTPDIADVDRVTPNHPVLLQRYDGTYFINSEGLRLTRLDKDYPNPPNGAYEKDRSGELTGELTGTAGERTVKLLPPPSRARTMIGARAIMKSLNGLGIVGIQDIVRIDEISQRKTYHTDVERSCTDLGIFEDLRAEGSLTVRVYPIATMGNWPDYEKRGLKPGDGDDMIRFGALKVFIDSFMMFEPFGNGGNYRGDFTFRVLDPQQVHDDIVACDRLGFDPVPHVNGDKAHEFLLDAYDDAIRENPARDRRFRFLHSWYPRLVDLRRGGAMGVFADISPVHLIRNAGTVDAALGPDRAKTAFAWRTMIDNGIRINIGTDWPGSYDGVNIGPNDPLENIYYAVTRKGLNAPDSEAWHPEQGLTVDEAIEAYTINPAYASREEDIKGSVTEGKLADLAVLSEDIRSISPDAIPAVKVLYTVFNGEIVHEPAQTSASV